MKLFMPLQGFFQALCHNTFCVPNWDFKNPKAFFHVENMKKSAGGLGAWGLGPEAQQIWTMRISYFSLKSITFC